MDFILSKTKISWEIYHKRYFQTAERQIFPIQTIDKNLITEKGESYGIEWMMKQERKNFFYLFSYSIGWTIRKNQNGDTYFPNFDRRHSLNGNWGIHFSRSGRFAVTGIIQSGNLQSFRYGKYDKHFISGYSDDNRDVFFINNKGRMPLYKRVDIQLFWEWKNWEFFFQVINIFHFKNKWIYWDKSVNWNDSIESMDSPYMPIVPTLGFTVKF